MKENKIQPARKSYFFYQSYVDLKKVVSGLWKKNKETALRFKDKMGNGKIPFVTYLFAMLSIYVFGSIMCTVFSIIHVFVILVMNLFVYVIALILNTNEKIYISLHGIFGACPYCKHHYKIPTYVCDCGAEHTKLIPNKYGVIKRTCQCGKKMPTSILNGRSKLKAKCPVCGHLLDNALGIQEAVPVCIPVIGGPSVGKTCYITAVMKELLLKVGPITRTAIQFYNQSNEITCLNMLRLYDTGELQTKTQDLNPASYNFFLTCKVNQPKRLLYFYDIAGEAFTSSDALATQKQYEYSNGFIFVIDPLSIPRIRESYSGHPKYEQYAASTADINETFDRFMTNLTRIAGLSKHEMEDLSCAIVVNKIDAFDLSDKIGKEAIERLREFPQNRFRKFDDLMDDTVKGFLNANGMKNFVKNMSMCFKDTKYFAVSSLGHEQDGNAFCGVMTMEPFAWVASKADSSMREMFDTYYNIKAREMQREKMS